MLRKSIVSAVVALASCSMTFADTVSLSGVAEGDSRFFDTFSDAFGQLDQGYLDNGVPDPSLDGFFRISGESGVTVGTLGTFDATTFNPTAFEQDLAPGVSGQQGTGVTIFPNQELFSLGNLTFDDSAATGVGTEVFSIIGFGGLDFAQNIADDDAILNNFTATPYVTSVSNLSGTVTFENGGLDSIDLTSDITFSYLTTAGVFSYDGAFDIVANEFSLFVDDTDAFGFGGVRLIWDASGTVTATAIPEPGSLLALAAGTLFSAARRRRR
ncbi:MAG: PEP-CTERM sorting domain-containing protein [Planctomycetota bacterium]